jgi:hypothetical protein
MTTTLEEISGKEVLIVGCENPECENRYDLFKREEEVIEQDVPYPNTASHYCSYACWLEGTKEY